MPLLKSLKYSVNNAKTKLGMAIFLADQVEFKARKKCCNKQTQTNKKTKAKPKSNKPKTSETTSPSCSIKEPTHTKKYEL